MSNQGQILADNEIVVGKIYADWCGACQQLLPSWKEMREELTKEIKNPPPKTPTQKYIFVEIESTNQDAQIKELNDTYLQGSKEKVAIQRGYPTLFKIIKNKLYYYDGARDPTSLINYYRGISLAKEVQEPTQLENNVVNPYKIQDSVKLMRSTFGIKEARQQTKSGPKPKLKKKRTKKRRYKKKNRKVSFLL